MKLSIRSAITIYGTESLLEWVKKRHPNLHRWTLSNLNHHPNVYMVDSEDQNCWGNCFEEHFETIFKNEISQYVGGSGEWPEISLELYKAWFTFEYSELVYDLSEKAFESFEEETPI